MHIIGLGIFHHIHMKAAICLPETCLSIAPADIFEALNFQVLEGRQHSVDASQPGIIQDALTGYGSKIGAVLVTDEILQQATCHHCLQSWWLITHL